MAGSSNGRKRSSDDDSQSDTLTTPAKKKQPPKSRTTRSQQHAAATRRYNEGSPNRNVYKDIPTDATRSKPIQLENYWGMDNTGRFELSDKILEYKFTQNDCRSIYKEHSAKLINDLQNLAKHYKNKYEACSVPVVEKQQQLEMANHELKRVKIELARVRQELKIKESHVDEAAFKREALSIIKGEHMMDLFRSFIFLSRVHSSTKALHHALSSLKHEFPKTIFEVIFDKLEMRCETLADEAHAKMAGKNVYTNGEKHVYNNETEKKRLWKDYKGFFKKFVEKFNSKRNQQSQVCRNNFGTFHISRVTKLSSNTLLLSQMVCPICLHLCRTLDRTGGKIR